MKLVSVITVNYNHSYLTEELLASIAGKNRYLSIEIIVVDNGSTINPVPQWEKEYPGITFIRSEINLGFAGGNNLAIRQAKGDYLLLINNDTEVTPTLIEELVKTLENHPEAGMVSPKIRYFEQPDMIQYAGFSDMNYFTARNGAMGMFDTDHGQYDYLSGPTGYGHGAAMMVSRAALNKAGLMSENYFLYYEELDWCEKIKRAGYTIHLNMQALLFHKESVSVGKATGLKEYLMNRNRILFIRRNCSPFTIFVFSCYFLFFVVPRNCISYIKNKQYGFIKLLAKAIWWNLTNTTDSTCIGYKIAGH